MNSLSERLLELALSIVLLFVFFAFQTSWVVYLEPFPIIFWLLFVFLFTWILIEKPSWPDGVILFFFFGFFWDIFSPGPLGVYFTTLIILATFLKFFLNHYVRIPFCKQI